MSYLQFVDPVTQNHALDSLKIIMENYSKRLPHYRSDILATLAEIYLSDLYEHDNELQEKFQNTLRQLYKLTKDDEKWADEIKLVTNLNPQFEKIFLE